MTYSWSDASGQTLPLPLIRKPSSKTIQDDLALNVSPVFPEVNCEVPFRWLTSARTDRGRGEYSTSRVIRFKTVLSNPWW